MQRREFDREFFHHYYARPGTAVISADDVLTRARFVLAYLAHLQVDVRSVLDAGCGTGLWRRALRRINRDIRYTGIDPSEYLCRRYGWEQTGIHEYRGRRLFDLVVCQDVMQYLTVQEVDRGIATLARVCRGALYFDVATRDDLESGLLDATKTDGRIFLRQAAWYRRKLEKQFVNAGGGVFIAPRAKAVILALERADASRRYSRTLRIR